jgi:hypothetical protein
MVLLVNDGLAFENRASAPATNPYDDALIDASPAQIARCGATEIVEDEPAVPQLLARPCLRALTALRWQSAAQRAASRERLQFRLQ